MLDNSPKAEYVSSCLPNSGTAVTIITSSAGATTATSTSATTATGTVCVATVFALLYMKSVLIIAIEI